MLTSVQTGVLVAMCIVFVLLASLVVYLIVLWWNSRQPYSQPLDAVGENAFVLHFIDMSNTPHSVDIKAAGITDGKSLRSALAAASAVPDGASLALMYVGDEGRAVEMDLDQLVFPDENLEMRMRHTAERPLLLCRQRDAPGYIAGASPHHVQNNKYYDVIDVSCSRHGGRVSPVRVQHAGNVLHRANNDGVVPSPVILPRSSRITCATPVCIMAAWYLTQDGGTVLDNSSTVLVEEALMENVRRTVTLIDGSSVVVEPSKQAAWLMKAGDTNGGVPLVRRAAEAVHYTVDNMSSVQWRPYKHPIFLPPGRWCVRAEASTADHAVVETTSRVFTVDIVPRKR